MKNATPEPKTGAQWTLRLMGGVRLERDGKVLDRFPTKRSALILARLAMSRHRQVSRDDLADALWPDDFPDATRIRLRQELRRLRDALGEAENIVEADRTWVKLREDLVDTDIWAFDRVIARSRVSADANGRIADLERAIAWVDGSLVPESSEPWILGERESLRRKRIEAQAQLAEAYVQNGDARKAIDIAQELARQEPLNEDAAAALIKARRATGSAADARREYLEFEARLTRQLGSSPSDGLRRLAMAPIEASPAVEPVIADQLTSPTATKTPGRWRPTPKPDQTYGRDVEISVLSAWLAPESPVRAVTLSGPGGVGKTHLSLAVAQALQDKYVERLGFVELAPETDASAIMAVRAAMGLSSESPDPTDILETLGDGDALLVIDNAEHVLDSIRPIVRTILEKCPNVRVMTTSRQRLDLGDEREFPITPLAIPDVANDLDSFLQTPSVALFLDEARRLRRDFGVDPETRAYLALLLKRLEGLPLAVQMAAHQIDALTLREIFEGLDDSFTRLVLRDPTAVRRHISLRNTYDWSYHLLTPDLQSALKALATFPGGWTLDMASAFLERDDALDVVRALLNSSLVFVRESIAGTRYTMLESVRAFALEDLSKSEFDGLMAKQSRIVADKIWTHSRSLHSQSTDALYQSMFDELPNAIAALDWAIEGNHEIGFRLGAGLWRFWYTRGDAQEGIRYFQRLLAVPYESPSADIGESFFGYATLCWYTVKEVDVVPNFKKAIEIFKACDRPVGVAWAQYNLAGFLFEGRHFENAMEIAEEAMKLLRENFPPERHGQVTVIPHGLVANSLAGLGKLDEALATMEEVFANRIAMGDASEIGKGYGELAEIYFDRGEPEMGLPLVRTGARHLKDIGTYNFLATQVALICEQTPDEEERAQQIQYGEAFMRRMHLSKDLMRILAVKGRFEPDWTMARDSFAEALSIAQTITSAPRVLLVFVAVADRLNQEGERARAKALVDLVDRERKLHKVRFLPREQRYVESVSEELAAETGMSDWTALLRAMPWNSASALLASFLKVESK